MSKIHNTREFRNHVLDCVKNNKVIYYDSEYCFLTCKKKSEWNYSKATLRLMTYKIGTRDIVLVDVWNEPHHWGVILKYLEEGYLICCQNLIADVRSDLAPMEILPYLQNGQGICTLQLERLIHGMTDPIGEWSDADIEDESEDESEDEDTPFLEKKGQKLFALDSIVYRHTGVKLKKLYQDARNYLAADLKEGVLEYAKEDVKYLPRILRQQIEQVELINLWEVLYLNTKLWTTVWINFHYGIAINTKELVDQRKSYKERAADLEGKLLLILPKVGYTDTQLIDQYFDIYWRKGVQMCGVTSKTKALTIVKKKENHALTDIVMSWVAKNREVMLRTPNLNAHAQKLEAFNRAGLKLKDTAEVTIKNYVADNESPLLESYLTWQRTTSLLKKTLNRIDYGIYLREDDTVRTTYNFCHPLNGRSSSANPSVQTIPRDLKSLFGAPKGMVRISYDLAAIELMKLLNDFPNQDLIKMTLDDTQDLHLFNCAAFFGQNYKDLLRRHKEKDPEVKKMRNAAKTVIYFLQYKTPKKPEDRFVTGTIKLMEIFKTDLGWELTKDEAEKLIIVGEKVLDRWTKEKLAIDADILRLSKENRKLESQLFQHLTQNRDDMNAAIEEGIIYFRGAKGMYYKFDIMRDKMYTPERTEYDESTGDSKIIREYVNSRSLYSCRVAGPVAIAAKSAVEKVQRYLLDNYGHDKARLSLFVHDSFEVYCLPELAEEIEKAMCQIISREVYQVGGFSLVPVTIEGGIEGKEERKVTYDGKGYKGL